MNIQRLILTSGIALCLMASVGLNGCASDSTSSTSRFIDDSAITAKIKGKLLDDQAVSGLAISVETYHGVVQLSGFANSNYEIKLAERLAREIDGVRAVRNDILLKY